MSAWGDTRPHSYRLVIDPERDDYYRGVAGVLYKDGERVWAGYDTETVGVVLGLVLDDFIQVCEPGHLKAKHEWLT